MIFIIIGLVICALLLIYRGVIQRKNEEGCTSISICAIGTAVILFIGSMAGYVDDNHKIRNLERYRKDLSFYCDQYKEMTFEEKEKVFKTIQFHNKMLESIKEDERSIFWGIFTPDYVLEVEPLPEYNEIFKYKEK